MTVAQKSGGKHSVQKTEQGTDKTRKEQNKQKTTGETLNFDPYEWSKKSDGKTEIVMWDKMSRSNYMLSTRNPFYI